MLDPGAPLCTAEQFTAGPFGDLVSELDDGVLDTFLLEATRMCEDQVDRRLAPFTITETHRAEGIDPVEYGANGLGVPMSIQGTLGMSWSNAVGGLDLVRHCWLDQKAPRYQDMWAYSDISILLILSYGGTQAVPGTSVLGAPEPDTGHMWFQLGTFLPEGSRIQVTYSGGYVLAIPASLVRACRYMCASLIVRELNPGANTHNPDQLHTDALMALAPWVRS